VRYGRKINHYATFLKSKVQEYELLQAEISLLVQETESELTSSQSSFQNISLISDKVSKI
jgi:hypothetical protein